MDFQKSKSYSQNQKYNSHDLKLCFEISTNRIFQVIYHHNHSFSY